jgi:hypothetical protein
VDKAPPEKKTGSEKNLSTTEAHPPIQKNKMLNNFGKIHNRGPSH